MNEEHRRKDKNKSLPKTTIKYTSANGYTGILYGQSSMSIGKVREDGTFDEYLHTGARAGGGVAYLKHQVDTFPEFLEMLTAATEDHIIKAANGEVEL